ncbi:XK-related protein 8-like [Stigmatopora nigra]
MTVFQFSKLDCFLTYVGLVFLLLDIVLDVLTVVAFYQEGEYVYLGVSVVLLVGSSLLGQIYSWLWYSYDENGEMVTKVQKHLRPCQLKVVHILQLGVFLRRATVVDLTTHSCITKGPIPKDLAVYAIHDLSLLCLFEAFSQSAPQLVLMLTIILQREEFHYLTALKALGSASAIALTVTRYHRCLRSFVPEKAKQRVGSSVVYFVWNLLLISSRLSAMALFASIHPCLVFPHLFCSWMLLFYCAWRSKTTMMDSPGGEWLYRATVGLIWYFTWFNVSEGMSRYNTGIYHCLMLLDICLLSVSWWWTIHMPNSFYALAAVLGVIMVYVLGLMLKIVYYEYFHPNIDEPKDEGTVLDPGPISDHTGSPKLYKATGPRGLPYGDEVDGDERLHNKRMRKLAANFYS